ncbi:hypothetical protein KFU94_36255 [Chloroflexi bacterium TSY]|nr:hypothetical protein [Chloroflexi bacterium TSY]
MQTDNRETLLSILRSGSYIEWKRLATGPILFNALCEMLKNHQTCEVRALLDEHQQFVENYQPRELMLRWWTIVDAIVTCAEIAEIDHKDGKASVRFQTLLSRLASQQNNLALDRRLPERSDHLDPHIAVSREGDGCAPLDGETWHLFVRQSLDRLMQAPLLSGPWAWDVVRCFSDDPRPLARQESITVPLVVGDTLGGQNEGVLATLTLQLLSDVGSGLLYPDPVTMSFVTRDEAFQQAEQNGVSYLCSEGLWKENETIDVRWRLLRQDRNPLVHIEGGSAGGAFALGLAQLLANT